MVQIARQQLCAELAINKSTVRRLELVGLPFTPIGKRTKRYDLEECRTWLREVYCPGAQRESLQVAKLSKRAREFMETARKMKRRVEPS
jgi:hypothetical protein